MTATSPRPQNFVRAPRRVYDRPLGLLFKGVYFVCQGLEISEGGLLVGVDLALAKGEWVLISLLLPSGSAVVVRGEILYRKPLAEKGVLPQFGLKFLGISVADRRAIRDYVSAKTRSEADLERSQRQAA